MMSLSTAMIDTRVHSARASRFSGAPPLTVGDSVLTRKDGLVTNDLADDSEVGPGISYLRYGVYIDSSGSRRTCSLKHRL